MDSLEAKKAEVAQAMFNGVSDGAMGLDKPEVADPSPRTETDIPETGTTEA
jgi:hypothetical protein